MTHTKYTKKFSQKGFAYPKGEAPTCSHRIFEVYVTSTADGKYLSIRDPSDGTLFGMDADLIAYWFEHGTEEGAEVIRNGRYGRDIYEDVGGVFHCSECDYEDDDVYKFKHKYCPNCGVKILRENE